MPEDVRDTEPLVPAFFDTETTGLGEDDRLCQVALKVHEDMTYATFRPPVPISIGSMAVHQITNRMVEGLPPFAGSSAHATFRDLAAREHVIFVAHNAPFDVAMLKKEGVDITRWICTLKVARLLDKDCLAEQYALQYLRHYFGLDIDGVPHDARGDVIVLEKVFARLVELFIADDRFPMVTTVQDALKEMVRVSTEPSLIRKFPFGKYNGMLLEDVAKIDRGYLIWLLSQKTAEPAKDEDWIHTLKHHLGR
jgi:DNA polymerase III epsilon subunit-like protein